MNLLIATQPSLWNKIPPHLKSFRTGYLYKMHECKSLFTIICFNLFLSQLLICLRSTQLIIFKSQLLHLQIIRSHNFWFCMNFEVESKLFLSHLCGQIVVLSDQLSQITTSQRQDYISQINPSPPCLYKSRVRVRAYTEWLRWKGTACTRKFIV